MRFHVACAMLVIMGTTVTQVSLSQQWPPDKRCHFNSGDLFPPYTLNETTLEEYPPDYIVLDQLNECTTYDEEDKRKLTSFVEWADRNWISGEYQAPIPRDESVRFYIEAESDQGAIELFSGSLEDLAKKFSHYSRSLQNRSIRHFDIYIDGITGVDDKLNIVSSLPVTTFNDLVSLEKKLLAESRIISLSNGGRAYQNFLRSSGLYKYKYKNHEHLQGKKQLKALRQSDMYDLGCKLLYIERSDTYRYQGDMIFPSTTSSKYRHFFCARKYYRKERKQQGYYSHTYTVMSFVKYYARAK